MCPTFPQPVCAFLVPLLACLQTLLSQHGQALPEGVHLVDWAGVVVDTPLALVAVPVLAKPVHVKVKRLGDRLARLDLQPADQTQTSVITLS